jgi:hypothetical protein
MKTRTCAADGYVEKAYESFTETTWICTNAWHPTHPGDCPKCGYHWPELAGLGMKEASCPECLAAGSTCSSTRPRPRPPRAFLPLPHGV